MRGWSQRSRGRGETREVPMQWTGERDGQYRARSRPARRDVRGAGRRVARGKTLGSGHRRPRRARRRRVLRRDHACPAAAADRRRHRRPFLYAGDDDGMPDDLRYTGRGVTTVEERELWHMPIVLMLFVGLCAPNGAIGAPSASRRGTPSSASVLKRQIRWSAADKRIGVRVAAVRPGIAGSGPDRTHGGDRRPLR